MNMPNDCDCCPKSEGLLRYEAETERLRALTDFVSRFAPAVGEAKQPNRGADTEMPPDVVHARNAALRQAFEAINILSCHSQSELCCGPLNQD